MYIFIEHAPKVVEARPQSGHGPVGVFATEKRARFWAAQIEAGEYQPIPKVME